jgi:hypothetical protein
MIFDKWAKTQYLRYIGPSHGNLRTTKNGAIFVITRRFVIGIRCVTWAYSPKGEIIATSKWMGTPSVDVRSAAHRIVASFHHKISYGLCENIMGKEEI